MKKLLLLAIALVSLGVFAAPKADAGVFIGIGLPVFPVYPAYYPGYYAPAPYYYGCGYPYGYAYRGYYGHVYNGRVVDRGHKSQSVQSYRGDK